MKKNLLNLKKIVICILMTLTGVSFKAQTLNFISTPSVQCQSPGASTVVCVVTSSASGAAYYNWSVNTATPCSGWVQIWGAMFSLAGTSTASAVFTCPGTYTIACSAVASNSSIISTVINTIVILPAPSTSVIPLPGLSACAGTTFTFVNTGAVSYTTFGPGIGSVVGSNVVFTPTASGCYTVQSSSASGCIGTTVKCVSVIPVPVLSLNQPASFTACSNAQNNLIASGASNYTWTSASGSSNSSAITATAVGCYTVTASNSGCGTTSSAVCVTSVAPSPTVSYGLSSNSVCLGGSINYTASGASNYTWVIAPTNTTSPTNYIYTNNGSFTPTVPGVYCATLTASNNNGCNYSSPATCFTVFSTPSISLAPSYTGCSSSGVYISASGASSYTWNTGALTNAITVYPTSSTCYTVYGSSPTCPGTSSAVTCVSITPTPSVYITGPSNVCPGSVNLYTATGASSYTWINTNNYSFLGSGSVIAITAAPGLCFIANAPSFGPCGVSIQSTICITATSPSVFVTASANSVCAGASVTLTASGAVSYTWSNGATGSSIVVNPTVATCYTVTGTNSGGCTGSFVKCINILANPLISVSGASSVCSGNSAIFTASGATSYLWSNAATTNTVSVSPASNTCYSVIGTAANGCTNTATKCLTVLATPTITISGSNTVCIGSSVTFTASGAGTYIWNTSANTSTLNVLPTASGVYTVTGTGPGNACTSSATVALTVYTNCAIVWPGDANRDGVVNNSDVFELGLAASSTGASRTSASISWTGQYATAWSGAVSTGWNLCHADCNGDGVVNSSDTAAISANYSNTHAFKSSSSSTNPDLMLVPQLSEVYSGVWNVMDIVLGDASNTLSQIYGIAYDVDYDHTMVLPDSVKIVYTPSFLNISSQNIEFGKIKFTNDKLYAANVRTNQNNTSGNGKIGELWIKLSPAVPENSSFNFGLSNGKKVSAASVHGTLSTGTMLNMNVNGNATGLKESKLLQSMVRLYPNPANNVLMLESNGNEKTAYHFYDLTGRSVLSGDFVSAKTIDISALEKGFYLVEFTSAKGSVSKKLVVE